MSITVDALVGYTKAEFAKASRWRLILLIVQFLAVVPAALSVVVTGDDVLYVLAVGGPVLLIAWWLARSVYRRSRSAAHGARRAVLIAGGLGAPISPGDHQRLRQRFTVDEPVANRQIDPDYYATGERPGLQRLGEMLEESAFYSKEVHRVSANFMIVILIVFVTVAIVVALLSAPYASRVTAVTGIKVILAVSVFILSSDVIGAISEHREASRGAESVQNRMAAAYATGYPEGDVLLAMGDYNEAMEGAPEAVPGVFGSMVTRLNQRWAEYKDDRAQARAELEAGA
ncbi:hypothetical protein [Sphingomonas sp. CFBP 13706]|uniref:hypothetical protein n=1 Tax=Sphingomonas sp. CFBP 13706 TaxID=2775314 RepID=UPI00177E9611|nr:hypothetical protein [Sphingomonas sp. CFBP 13706]MBD8735339.1 hypothetical protein [Sphingomonas sp. CFBP 13706]